MARKKGKLKSGTWVERDLFTSRAFWALRGAAPQLLIMFLGKRDMMKDGNGSYSAKNARNITMTYLELENLWTEKSGGKVDGIERKRIIRSNDELLAKGFIEIVHQGGAYQQDKTIYALSENWRFWREGTVFNKRTKETRQRGYVNKKQNQRAELPPIHTGGSATQNNQYEQV